MTRRRRPLTRRRIRITVETTIQISVADTAGAEAIADQIRERLGPIGRPAWLTDLDPPTARVFVAAEGWSVVVEPEGTETPDGGVR